MDQLRSLLAVDRGVGLIVAALRATGRLRHTMIVFTSDNGLSWGEHRWFGKAVPYDESIRVPLVVRDDSLITPGQVDRSHLVLNIDLAPTFAGLAGGDRPSVDGRSLLPLLSRRRVPWRRDFLVENLKDPNTPVPTFCSIRSSRYDETVYQYADTGRKEYELYDLRKDPHEIRNMAADPAYARVRAKLRRRLGTLCDPPPPNSTLP